MSLLGFVIKFTQHASKTKYFPCEPLLKIKFHAISYHIPLKYSIHFCQQYILFVYCIYTFSFHVLCIYHLLSQFVNVVYDVYYIIS